MSYYRICYAWGDNTDAGTDCPFQTFYLMVIIFLSFLFSLSHCIVYPSLISCSDCTCLWYLKFFPERKQITLTFSHHMLTDTWLGLWCLTLLSTIFQLYRGVSFIGGRSQGTQRKPPTCRKSLINISNNVVSSTLRHERGSNTQP